MNVLKNELESLTGLMKDQECYVKYQELLNKIKKDPELYEKLNEFRKKNIELHYHRQTLKDEARLERQFHDFMEDELIHDFLYWEQQTLKMLRMIYKEIGGALTLDYGFLS